MGTDHVLGYHIGYTGAANPHAGRLLLLRPCRVPTSRLTADMGGVNHMAPARLAHALAATAVAVSLLY